MFAATQTVPPIALEGRRPVLCMAYRYGLSTIGPVAVSAAHFVASLIFLRLLRPEEFGRFAFLLIVVPFCLSAAGALLGAPASLTRGKDEITAQAEIRTLQKVSLLVSTAAGIVVTALMFLTGAKGATALLFGLYGAAFTLRSFFRSLSNVRARLMRVAASDVLYGALLVAGLLGLASVGPLDMRGAALVLALAALASFAPFGWGDFSEVVRPAGPATFLRYRPMWRDVTRWSLLGVVLTELTANAHAYFVTFISGPGTFGLLALGALFMRPASLVLSALPDIDQPLMTRRIAHGDIGGAFRVVHEFRTAAAAVLAATIVLSVALVVWFPHLLLKHYGVPDVLMVLVFWIAITAARTLRTPESVFVMATGNYPALARIGAWSSVVALGATFILLCTAGPIASLGGVLAGEILILVMLAPLTRPWRRRRHA
jgi:hypothetical protein